MVFIYIVLRSHFDNFEFVSKTSQLPVTENWKSRTAIPRLGMLWYHHVLSSQATQVELCKNLLVRESLAGDPTFNGALSLSPLLGTGIQTQKMQI